MSGTKPTVTPISVAEVRRMQEIEGNAFTAEDEAMFAMFEREGWDTAQCIAYVRKKLSRQDEPQIAE